jgi:hypothetical protein
VDNTILGIVLKPDPAGRPVTRMTRGWNRAGFKKNPARDLARENLVDLEGQRATHKTGVNPHETRYIYIYIYSKTPSF